MSIFPRRKGVKVKVRAKKGGGLIAKAKAGLTTAGIVLALEWLLATLGWDPSMAPEGAIQALAQVLMLAVDHGEAIVALMVWLWPSSADDIPETVEA